MDRKIYYSFHDIPYEQSYGYYEKPKLQFSQREIIELVISIVVISLAFSIARSVLRYGDYKHIVNFLMSSFLAVVTAFACHEIAHKYVGIIHGYWSEYRMFPQGLMFALLLSFAGFVFAAPGAVQIFGTPSQSEIGKISAAGPITNLVIATVSTSLSVVIGGTIGDLLVGVAYINAFLAFFNLIPFGPLDGRNLVNIFG